MYINIHEVSVSDKGPRVTAMGGQMGGEGSDLTQRKQYVRVNVHLHMSAAAVSGSAGVRAGVRRRGHDPIVGGKSGAKLGNKWNALSSAHVSLAALITQPAIHPQDTHSFTTFNQECCEAVLLAEVFHIFDWDTVIFSHSHLSPVGILIRALWWCTRLFEGLICMRGGHLTRSSRQMLQPHWERHLSQVASNQKVFCRFQATFHKHTYTFIETETHGES